MNTCKSNLILVLDRQPRIKRLWKNPDKIFAFLFSELILQEQIKASMLQVDLIKVLASSISIQ